VSDCNPFGQGINMRPCSDIIDNNQSNTCFYIYSSIYFFDDFVTLHIFFATSSLEFIESTSMSSRVPREHLLAVTSGRIAVVGTKVFELPPMSIERSNRLARLNIESGISPLCL